LSLKPRESCRCSFSTLSREPDVHIVFLTHYFPPEVNAPATRTFEHARVWVKEGHTVTVLTNVPNHPGGEIYPGYRNGWLQEGVLDGIQVRRMLTWAAPNAGFMLRIANYVFYMLMAMFQTPFLRRPDVVVSTTPQFFCGLAGYFVSRLRRVPWVLEIRDLWPESIVAVGAMKKSFAIRLLEKVEAFAYRKADHIIVVTDSFVPHVLERGGSADRISVIKNGVDLDFYDPDRKAAGLAEELGLEGRFVGAYVGTHGMAHGLEVILEAAALLRSDEHLGFLLVGDGAERQRLLKRKEKEGLDNVVMLGQQPKDRMPDIWAITGASLVLLRDRPVFRTVIPSKIFESMAMRRPIILGVRGEVEQIVREAGAGLCITPENGQELAQSMRALAYNDERSAAFGRSGRDYVVKHFDRSKLAREYAELLTSVAARQR